MHYDISIWFLIFSLFVPRITLLISWLFHAIPPNNVSSLGDFFGALLFPRILILVYIWDIQKTNPDMTPWFWIHFVAMIIAWTWNYIKINNWIESHKK